MVSLSSEELCYCSWCFEKILEDRECFLLQMKCMMSASVAIICYWAWLSIEEYTRENNESVKNILESYGFLLHLVFELPGMTACPTVFPNVSTSSKKCRKLKRKVIFNSCLNLLLFFSLFLFWLFLFHVYPLAGNTWHLLRFFLLFNSVTFYVTAYNVGVFKPTVHDLSNSSYRNMKFYWHFFGAAKVWFWGRQAGIRIS